MNWGVQRTETVFSHPDLNLCKLVAQDLLTTYKHVWIDEHLTRTVDW